MLNILRNLCVLSSDDNSLSKGEYVIKEILTQLKKIYPSLIAAALIFIGGLIINKITIRIMSKALNRSKIEPTSHSFMLSLTKTVLYVFTFVIMLSAIGVPMTSIVATIGAASLAIGLALQDSLSNVAGGFIILFTRPFKCGDFISVNSNSGKVDSISIVYTKIITVDNKSVFIPNGTISKSTIENYTEQGIRQLDVIFSISYNEDFNRAIKVIKSVVSKQSLALNKPSEPLVRVCEHADSCIKILTRVWVVADSYFELKFNLLEQVKTEFDKEKIEIPFNQLDVNIHNN